MKTNSKPRLLLFLFIAFILCTISYARATTIPNAVSITEVATPPSLLKPATATETPNNDFLPPKSISYDHVDLWNISVSQTSTTAPPTFAPTWLDNVITNIPDVITNISVNPYLTFAPKTPPGSAKIGGGLFIGYNISQNFAAGLALDWLGHLSLVSAQVNIQAPFHLVTLATFLKPYPWANNVSITPFVMAGAATPYQGNGQFNGTPFVTSDIGGYILFGHLWGGQFDAGGAYGKWTGSGPYANVTRYHLFLGWTWH